MTALTESVPDLQHPVALAFAVAAFQSVKSVKISNMKDPTYDEASVGVISPSSSMMQDVSHENDDFRFVEHSSVASYCDNELEDDQHTVTTTTPSTAPTPSSATSSSTTRAAAGAAGTSSKNREQDAASRLARSRDRNREHARRTRIRKKAQLAALQIKVAHLEAERVTLRQGIEECSIAGILLGLHDQTTTAGGAGSSSSGKEDDCDHAEVSETQTLLEHVNSTKDASANSTSSTKVALLANGKRKQFLEHDHQDDDEDDAAAAAAATAAHKQPTHALKMVIDGKTALVGGGRSHINWKTGIYNDHAGLQKQFTPVQLENLRYVLSVVSYCIVSYRLTERRSLD
jgi:hypothetical protein